MQHSAGRSTAYGLQDRTPGELVEIVLAVWFELIPARSALHRVARTPPCDTWLVVHGVSVLARDDAGRHGGDALRFGGDCVCLDLLVDALVEADRFLESRGPELANAPGAVRTHVRTRALAEWTRRRRVRMGAQARTDRLRRSARARALPDDFHRAVFEHLADEAGSLAPLDDEAQLYRRLAELMAREPETIRSGPGSLEDRVAAAVPTIAAACCAAPLVSAGPGHDGERVTWWERYIERPLGRRERSTEAALVHQLEARAAL